MISNMIGPQRGYSASHDEFVNAFTSKSLSCATHELPTTIMSAANPESDDEHLPSPPSKYANRGKRTLEQILGDEDASKQARRDAKRVALYHGDPTTAAMYEHWKNL